MTCIAPVRVSSSCPVCLLFCSSPCRRLRMTSNERPVLPGGRMPPIPPRPCWASWALRCTENGGYGPAEPGWPWATLFPALIPLGPAWAIGPWLPTAAAAAAACACCMYCCCWCCCWCWWASARAATWASCSEKTQTTRAATLWWMMVLLSSPTMSIPNSYHDISGPEHDYNEIKTYNDIITFELERFWFVTFAAEPLAVNKRSIRALHILDKDLCQRLTHKSRRKRWQLTLLPSSQTSACCLLRTFESKKPFLSPGAVFELVCLPIFVRWFVRDMCFGCQVSLSG